VTVSQEGLCFMEFVWFGLSWVGQSVSQSVSQL